MGGKEGRRGEGRRWEDTGSGAYLGAEYVIKILTSMVGMKITLFILTGNRSLIALQSGRRQGERKNKGGREGEGEGERGNKGGREGEGEGERGNKGGREGEGGKEGGQQEGR